METLLQEIENIKNKFFQEDNIFELTGMGRQEIKHSNFLAHLLGLKIDDSYYLLWEIMKKLGIEKYPKEDLRVFRENDDKDILIIDDKNKTLVVIENKTDSFEREDGDDDGQLQKYKKTTEARYPKYSSKVFIFLTLDGSMPSAKNRKDWRSLSYEAVAEIIKKGFSEEKFINKKLNLVAKDYVELLYRKGVIVDKELQTACQALWKKPEFKDCLKAICEFKQDLEEFKNTLRQAIQKKFPATLFDYSYTGSNYAIYTKEWEEYFNAIGNRDHNLEFGCYIVKSEIYIWISKEHSREEKANKAFQNFKEKFNNNKNCTSRIIPIKAEALGYDGFNLDEIGEEIIERFLEIIEKINQIFLELSSDKTK